MPTNYPFVHPYPPMILDQDWDFEDVNAVVHPEKEDYVLDFMEDTFADSNATDLSYPPPHPSLNRQTDYFQPHLENYNNLAFLPVHNDAHGRSQHQRQTQVSVANKSYSSTETAISAFPSPVLSVTDLSSMSPEPHTRHDQHSPSIIATTLEGSEESRRRNRRREQNRKAQFAFRQKRKDEIQRLQSEIAELKKRLAARDARVQRQAKDSNVAVCALCKGYAALCQ